MASVLQKRVWGWMAFDWATQPFYTLGLTFIFGPYFATVAAEFFLTSGMTERAADARAQSLWSLGQTLAGLFIAFTAPVLGAYADSTGRRLPWLVAFSAVFVVCTALLWFMVPDGSATMFCLVAFSIAFVAAEYALVFTNAILPGLGDHDEIGRISGDGAAIGYWGGFVALLIFLPLFFELDEGKTMLGISPGLGLLNGMDREGTRAVGPFIAVWFLIFMIPYWLYVREDEAPNRAGGLAAALRDLKTSLAGVVHRRSLLNFLISSMLYRDALAALYAFGGVYAALVLDWGLMQIAAFGIIGVVAAAVSTSIAGRADRRFGPRPVIHVCIVTLMVVCVIIVGMTREQVLGIPLSPGSPVPDLLFYICGSIIGGAGGGIYSASRSMMVRHTHPERPTEAFGLFALSGKATAFLAPGLIAFFTWWFGDARLGFTPVIGLFLAGFILLRWVEPEGDRAEWSNDSIPAP
jgi:UMF1 family MFS transporter